jgi:hypothetical protein
VGDLPFAECDLDAAGNVAQIRLTSTEEVAIALSGATPGAPVFLAVLGPQQLWPEAIGRIGIQSGEFPAFAQYGSDTAATWLLRCPIASGLPECTEDFDLDGAPDLGDCSPLLASIGPEAEDPPFASAFTNDLDMNCDGWPNSLTGP